jgi:hypothetical protein
LTAWLTLAVAIYLLAPGHPLSLLTGVPWGMLSLSAAATMAICLYGFGRGLPARTSRLLAILVFGLAALKLVGWALAPEYGLAASYYARDRLSGRIERSPEWRSSTFTLVDRAPASGHFDLHFFNDVERFNSFDDTHQERPGLPFAVRWAGMLDRRTAGPVEFRLEASDRATVAIAGTAILASPGVASVPLNVGQHPIVIEFVRAGQRPPELTLEINDGAGFRPLATIDVLARPSPLTAVDRWLVWMWRGLDFAVLVVIGTIIGAGARHARWTSPRAIHALLLLATMGWALVSTRDLYGRAVLLEGAQDWLTYESYARDILLNGPLMTLGKPLGQGRAYFFQPFYPYYLAGLHWLTGEGIWGPVVLQLVGAAVAGVIGFWLTRALFGERAAWWATGLFAVLYATQLDWIARKLLSENLYFILLPAAILALVKVGRNGRLGTAAIAGVFLGLACITRAPTMAFVPIAALVVWLSRDRDFRAPLVIAAVCGLIVVLVPMRNLVVSGRPALMATNGGATLLIAHQPPSYIRLAGIDRNPTYNALRLDRPTREVLEFARQDPLGYLATMVPLGLYSIGIPNGIEGQGTVAPDILMVTILYVAGVVGMKSCRRLETVHIHAFVALHMLVMMTFLPYVYGYRQVLPMQFLMLTVCGAVLARWTGGVHSVRSNRSEGRAEGVA